MRIALGIEYDGSRYYGWQRQQEVISVQEELEKVLSRIANHPVEVQCAGRTDAGVHATGQVVHFECQQPRPERAWTLGANAQLPDDIAVRWAKTVGDEFHARFSATARRYRYVIYNARFRPGILRSGLSHYYHPLDIELMNQAAPLLLGENDFSSFRAAGCQSNTPNRNIHHLQITRHGDYVVIDIQANAFLHHMVRNITGCLLEIGQGNQPPGWLGELLVARDRNLAATTAKAGGLYLVDVHYPESFNLPRLPMGPLFLPQELD